ncbi:MAG: hypothetical protein NTZ26_01615 [Candidatus Aminicenantes bacterium]|nr:hypothetical protein [Candidatus Aminicenantes bacterium]
MKSRSIISSGRFGKVGTGFVALFGFLGAMLIGSSLLAAVPQDQRHIGEEILLEALLGPRQLMVRVATGGCTGKDSFKVEMVKMPSASPQSAPHYVLTLNRIKSDDCKAFFPNGTPVLFDLEKELGLTGIFTYSLANKIYSPPGTGASEESFFGIIKKYFTIKN